MKNGLPKKKKLEFTASSTSQERMLREDNFASSENLKQVTLFKKSIREGPYFICVICNRCLYKRSIIRFDFNSYSSLVKEPVHLVFILPNEFGDLRRLERLLVAKRILFKKVTVMPKGSRQK